MILFCFCGPKTDFNMSIVALGRVFTSTKTIVSPFSAIISISPPEFLQLRAIIEYPLEIRCLQALSSPEKHVIKLSFFKALQFLKLLPDLLR